MAEGTRSCSNFCYLAVLIRRVMADVIFIFIMIIVHGWVSWMCKSFRKWVPILPKRLCVHLRNESSSFQNMMCMQCGICAFKMMEKALYLLVVCFLKEIKSCKHMWSNSISKNPHHMNLSDICFHIFRAQEQRCWYMKPSRLGIGSYFKTATLPSAGCRN